jgi:peptide/nickel transport system substrate-binding protein
VITRRRFIGKAATVTAAAAALPSAFFEACGGGSQAPKGDPNKPLVLAYVQGLPTLDPDKTAADVTRSVILAIYDSLLDYDIGKRQLVPRLAASWRSPDDKTIEFKLRPNVKFTNGEVLDANAVKFSLTRTLDPATKGIQQTPFANVQGVEVVDPLTVVWHLKNPDPILLQQLVTYPILAPKYATEHGDLLATQPIGSGPYKLKSWQQGYEVALERNDSYWGPKAGFRYASYRTIESPETQLAALLSGQIQIAGDLDPNQAKSLHGNSKVHVISKPKLLQALINLDQAGRTDANGPMKDKRVRQALNQAVNVDGIIKNILLGSGTRIAAGVHPAMFGFDPSVKPWDYNPAEAKKLLDAAGFASGFEARMISQTAGIIDQPETAQQVQRDLAQVGIKVTLQTVADPTAVGQLVRGGRAGPMVQFGNAAGGVFDAGSAYSFIFRCGNAFSYYCNKDFDALYLQQSTTLDQDKRKQVLSQMQKLLRDDAGSLFEWAVHGIWGISNTVRWPAYEGRDDKLYTARPA